MVERIVVLGGVAAGASAAAKARRESEDVEIVLVEAGPYISFANCGLPYYVGGEIAQRDDLFVTGADLFAKRFDVDVRVNTRAVKIDRESKTVTLAPSTGETEEQLHYDKLVVATGAVGIVPPIEGIHRDDVFTVRTVPDVDAIGEHLARRRPSPGEEALRAVVIGGGYIGLETAEQLHRRGLKVTVIEMADQVMLPLDAEMAAPLAEALKSHGVDVLLGDGVARIEESNGCPAVVTQSGARLPFDIGILAVGVRPNVEIASSAGIELGPTGAIRVDTRQRTNDPDIYAAGDNCEARHFVLDAPVNIPLAGPANKAGRVAGANAALDLLGASATDARRITFEGVLGTAIVRVFDTVAGATGLTEKLARSADAEYVVTYMPGASHAGYYPGAGKLLLKVLYHPDSGRLLGAQAVGTDGVDKRLDVLATAIAAEMTVEDLEQLDLCYAPPFGSAKDVGVMVGFASSNALRGQMPSATPQQVLDELAGPNPPLVLDVRTKREWTSGHLDDALHIPLDELRGRVGEVPSDRSIVVHCAGGYRSYVAQRILMNKGYPDVRNILGGMGLLQSVRDM